MRFEVVTEWQPNYLGKGKKKAGYTVYITGKETEIEKIDSVSNFIKEETGINFDGFADDTDYWNCFFLEISF